MNYCLYFWLAKSNIVFISYLIEEAILEMDKEDGIICSFNEFMDHLNKHVKDLHAEVTLNDRLYSEEDYPKLKALVVESGW